MKWLYLVLGLILTEVKDYTAVAKPTENTAGTSDDSIVESQEEYQAHNQQQNIDDPVLNMVEIDVGADSRESHGGMINQQQQQDQTYDQQQHQDQQDKLYYQQEQQPQQQQQQQHQEEEEEEQQQQQEQQKQQQQQEMNWSDEEVQSQQGVTVGSTKDLIDSREIRDTIGVIDPEEIMHNGDDHHHGNGKSVHSDHGGLPCTDCQTNMEQSAEARVLAEVAELNNFRPSTGLNVHDPHSRNQALVMETLKSNQELGPTFEHAVHGHDHVHSDDTDHKDGTRTVVKYQDIVDLELGDELLSGIDLSQLLEQERREAAEWRRQSGLEGDDDKIASRIKFLQAPDLDTAEWDDGNQGQESSGIPHAGESQLEHEMEMWGSTAAKDARKPYREHYRN